MKQADRWLLPDGIEEILPPQAHRIEQLRRHLLDKLDAWGYDLVMPPALEYLDSLLTGPGKNLELRTFKVTDQLSGRMMGLSADTTPQVARIDAHSLAPEGVSRLCYCRTVFHTKARSLLASRTPTQIGAELYGEAGLPAELEMISLMLTLLTDAGIEGMALDLGQVEVFRILALEAGMDCAAQNELLELFKIKSQQDVASWTSHAKLAPAMQQAFALLLELQGAPQALTTKLDQLARLVPATASALAQLRSLLPALVQRFSSLNITLDLSELRGYNYHTGIVFAAYIPGFGDAIAKGGRYDDTGASFGRARPAIGFSADLKVLARFGRFTAPVKPLVVAPQNDDPSLWQAISALRAQGYRVQVVANPAAVAAAGHLQNQGGQWQLIQA